jgi:hypothetical protein
MDRRCKHTFRPGCEDLEGRQLLSTGATPSIGYLLKLKPTLIHPTPIKDPRPPGTQGSNYVQSTTLQALLLIQTENPGGVPGFLYSAVIQSEQVPTSPLLNVDLLGPTGTTTGVLISLEPGDRILSLDGIQVNGDPAHSNVDQHIGVTTVEFAQAGSNTAQEGDIFIP